MIDLIQKIKTMVIYTVVVLIIGGLAGSYITYKKIPHADPAIVPDVKPEIHTVIIKDPTPKQKEEAPTAPIEITNTLTGNILTTYATNGFVDTTKTDRLVFPVLAPKWEFQADLYAGVVEKQFFYMIGGSAKKFLNERLYVEGGIAGSSFGGMVHGGVGFTLY